MMGAVKAETEWVLIRLESLSTHIREIDAQLQELYNKQSAIEDKISMRKYGKKMENLLAPRKMDSVLQEAERDPQYREILRISQSLLTTKAEVLHEIASLLEEHQHLLGMATTMPEDRKLRLQSEIRSLLNDKVVSGAKILALESPLMGIVEEIIAVGRKIRETGNKYSPPNHDSKIMHPNNFP